MPEGAEVTSLALNALDTDAGERLQARSIRRAVLLDLAGGDPDAERQVATGILEAEDDGEAMAITHFHGLPEEERLRIARWSRDHARRRCEIAAEELVDAAESLGLAEVEPEAVALLAAGTAVGKAIRR